MMMDQAHPHFFLVCTCVPVLEECAHYSPPCVLVDICPNFPQSTCTFLLMYANVILCAGMDPEDSAFGDVNCKAMHLWQLYVFRGIC
jgi:hypothetical protein